MTIAPGWRTARVPVPGALNRTGRPEEFTTKVPKTSEIEKQFHAADSPYRQLVAPQLNELNQFGYDLFTTGARG